MRHAVSVSHRVRVFDIIAIIEAFGDAMLPVHATEKDAGADVAELAIRGARGAPEFSRAWKWVGGGVELDKSVELGGFDRGELGFDPVFGALCGLNISRHKNRAFIRDIAKKFYSASFK